jgi:predicted Zn-dependent protease
MRSTCVTAQRALVRVGAMWLCASASLTACAPQPGYQQQPTSLQLRENAPFEEVVGAYAFQAALRSRPISHSPVYRAMVDDAMRRLVIALGETEFAEAVQATSWNVQVVLDDEVNAAAFPGGGIIVNTGLLDRYGRYDDAFTAVALAHELIHLMRGHLAERLAKHRAVIEEATRGVDLEHMSAEAALQVLLLIGLGELGNVMPFVKEQELEADRLGMHLLALAEYDPEYAPSFWQKLSNEGEEQSGFSLTHPTTPERLVALKRELNPARIRCRNCMRQHDRMSPVVRGPAVGMP